MHIHIYMRALRALVLVIGLFTLFLLPPFAHGEGNAVQVSEVTTSDAADGSMTVSFSLVSDMPQDEVRYGIAIYQDQGNGSRMLVDALALPEMLSLTAGEAVSREITYVPPVLLTGDYLPVLTVRSRTNELLGEYALPSHSFAQRDTSSPLMISSCDFQTLPSSGTLQCGLSNTGAEPATVRSLVTLREGGPFGETVGASLEQLVTVPASGSEQVSFSGFPKSLPDGSYTVEVSFFEGDTLLSRQVSATEEGGVIEATAGIPDASADPTTGDNVHARSTTLYAGALILALLLLLGVLVFSHRRSRVMMLALLLGAGLLTSTPSAWAQENTDPLKDTVFNAEQSTPAGLSCSDYYRFGSVQVLVSAPEVPPAGFPMHFTGEIVNENPYPVVDAQVYAKVFQIGVDFDPQNNGYPVADFFLVKDGLALPASSSIPFDFSWRVPDYLTHGQYQIAFFVTSAHRYNLLGLSFTDDVIGNVTSFSIDQGADFGVAPIFVKDAVTLNGEPYHFANFPPHFPDQSAVAVTAPLKNYSTETRSVTVTWKLYNWDGLREDQLLDTQVQTFILGPGETEDATYVGQPHPGTVSYILADASFEDTHSILNVRYVNDGKTEARINFPAVMHYPLTEGVENTVFSCLHAMNDSGTEGELTLALTTPGGREIAARKFSGPISSAMMAHAFAFTPSKTYTDFDLTATLVQNGAVVETITQQYRCAEITPGQCDWGSFPHIVLYALLGLILACITLFLLKRPRAAVPLAILFVAFALHAPSVHAVINAPDPEDGGTGGPTGPTAPADDGGSDLPTGDPEDVSTLPPLPSGWAEKTVQVSQNVTYPTTCYEQCDLGTGSCIPATAILSIRASECDTGGSGGSCRTVCTTDSSNSYYSLSSIELRATYRARVSKPEGTIAAGTSISVTSSGSASNPPRVNGDTYWFISGSTMDSPPGCWEDMLIPGVWNCAYYDVDTTGRTDIERRFGVVFAIPSVTITGGGAISCSGSTCTANSSGGAGTITVRFNNTNQSGSSGDAIPYLSGHTSSEGNIAVTYDALGLDDAQIVFTYNIPVAQDTSTFTGKEWVNGSAPSSATGADNSLAVYQGDSARLYWSSTAGSCTKSMSPSNAFWSGSTSANNPGSGEDKQVNLAPGNYSLYLDCGNASRKTVYLTVASAPTPSVNLVGNNSNGPLTITEGEKVNLEWSSANVTSCTGTNFSTGNATQNSTGVSVSPTSDTTYRITCTGSYGSVSDTVVVNVDPAASPVAYAISASPNPIQVCSPDTRGVTTITFNGPVGATLRVYAGSTLFAQKVSTGNPQSQVTGDWVYDGHVFSLRDASDGLTKATVTVSHTTSGCPNIKDLSSNVTPTVYSGTLTEGQNVTFRGQAYNSGGETLSGFSDNFTYRWGTSGSWTQIGGHISKTSLSVGGTSNDTSASFNLANSGTLQIQHCVDSQGTVIETNEGNNCQVASFSVAALIPNLVAANTAPSSGATFTTGESITFTGTATNNSSVAITEGGWHGLEIDLYSDGVDNDTSNDPRSGFDYYRDRPLLGGFTAGQSKNISRGENAGFFPAGTHRYRWNIDSTNGVTESNESDNRSGWTTFVVVDPVPNLTSDMVLTANGTLNEGQNVTFNGRVRNSGTVSVTTGFYDNFTYRWGTSGAWTQISQHLKSYSAGAPLAVGGTSNDTSASFNLANSGTLQIQHCIDSQADISETNETAGDNCEVTSFSVGVPSVTDISANSDPTLRSGTLTEGQSVTFYGYGWNGGTEAVSGFSDNFTYRWGTSGAWTQFGNYISKSSLSAGASIQDSSASLSLTSSGTLQIQFCVDSLGQITESNEGNNCQVASFSVGVPPAVPNLVAANTAPSSGATFTTGESITFNGTATNNSSASITQGGWHGLEVDVYSDGVDNNTSDTEPNGGQTTYDYYFDDTELGAFAPGEVKILSRTPPTGNFPIGTHRYRWNIDSVNQLAESNESDNRSGWTTFVVGAPSVTDISANNNPTLRSGTLTEGQNVTFNGSGWNGGTEPVSGFSDNFTYRWGTSGSWTQFGSHIPFIWTSQPGTGWSGDPSASLNLTNSGTLQIQYCVDSQGQITEGDETNNCQVGTFSVSAPSYSCTGTTPGNATLCSGDSSGLSSDTSKTAVSACSTPTGSAPKCEYRCNTGYSEVSGRCISGSVNVSPNEVAAGSTSVVSWSVSGSTSGLTCGVTGGSDSWSGASGSQTSSPIAGQTTYVLSCNGIALDQATVDLLAPPTLTANPRIVDLGDGSSLTYNLNGNTSCTLTGGGLNQALVTQTGTIPTGDVFGTTEYTITCGPVSASVTVEVREEGHET